MSRGPQWSKHHDDQVNNVAYALHFVGQALWAIADEMKAQRLSPSRPVGLVIRTETPDTTDSEVVE